MEGTKTHCIDEHINRVNSLCRLCSERTSRQVKDKYIPLKLCSIYAKDISQVYGIDVSKDEAGKHSIHFCVRCYRKLMKKVKKTRPDSASENLNKSFVWCHFDETLGINQCLACSHFERQCKGGRPHKPVKRKLDVERQDITGNGDSHSDISFGDSLTCTSTPANILKTTHMQTVSPVSKHTVHTASSPFKFKTSLRPLHQMDVWIL